MESDIYKSIMRLLETPGISVAELTAEDHMTLRQVKYRISKINELLKAENADILRLRNDNDIVVSDSARTALQEIAKNAAENERFSFNKDERLVYMALLLVLDMPYISLNDFMHNLGASKSTVLMDLKTLTQELEKDGLGLEYNRVRGYWISGNEMDIRRYMMRTIIYNRYTNVYDQLIDDYHLDLFDYSRLLTQELAQKHGIQFVEDRLYEFIYIFTFLKTRIKNGASASEEISKLPNIDIMTSTKEYHFMIDLLQNYSDTENISTADVKYLASWVLGISYGDANDHTQDYSYISDLVMRIMNRFELISGAHYSNSQKIFSQLYAHFRPAYYRLLFKLPIFNPLTERVKEEYQDLYDLVAETMKPFSAIFGEDIPDDEIAYLTMHFSVIYSGEKATGIPQKNALVICSNGVGSSAILYNELRDMFPSMNFLPPIEAAQFKDVDVPVDIIFATRYAEFGDTSIPVVRVNPVMTAEEQYQVIRSVHLQLNIEEEGRPSVDIVMGLIRQHADIHDENALSSDLLNYFASLDKSSHPSALNGHQLHLDEIITPDLILLHQSAADWNRAVRNAYQPLLDHAFITQHYIESTISALSQSRGYVVIAPHVALSHSRPEDGALAVAMGIYAMDEGVDFGNKDNDPVRYIFSLSATDNQSHLLCMSELLGLLNDPGFFSLLDSVNDPQRVLQYIRSRRQSEKNDK